MPAIDIGIGARPRLGGYYPPAGLTERQRAVLDALADALIPAEGGYPAPSEIGIADFVARYLVPAGEVPRWYPFLTADDLTARLDAIGRRPDDGQWAAELDVLSDSDPAFFATLRDLVYHGYYSHGAVTRLISQVIPAARDLRRAPQPYGYLDGMEDWHDGLLARVRGHYTATADVRRLAVLPSYTPAGPEGAQAPPAGRVAADSSGEDTGKGAQ
jgi:hypothetical protein